MARVFLQLAHSKLESRWDLQKCCFYSIKLRLANRWILVILPCSVKKVVAGVDRETLADIPKCEARHCQRWSRAAAGCTKVGVDGNTNESLNNESDLERV